MKVLKLTGLVLAMGLAGVPIAGCNLVTGAEGLEIDAESDDDAGVGGATATGVGGATATGSTSTSDASAASGVGGATTASGAGPTTSATTGAGTTSSTGTTTSGGGGESCGGSGPGTTPLDVEEDAFVTLINDYRSQNGLGALTPCISLNRAAQGHSEDMRDLDYFDHDNLDGDDPFDRMCNACFDLACTSQTAMGENIAAGNSGAQGTFDQWRNSPGHNANMLSSSFNFMGIGRAAGGGTYGTYWTNVFAGNDEASCY